VLDDQRQSDSVGTVANPQVSGPTWKVQLNSMFAVTSIHIESLVTSHQTEKISLQFLSSGLVSSFSVEATWYGR
jgi:hypothetical protein